ncbi:hypothetical protein D9M72_192750 [compost metagenome]
MVHQERAGQVSEERTEDEDQQVAASVQRGQVARRLQVGREPGEHRVVCALDAGCQQAGENRRSQKAWLENRGERTRRRATGPGLTMLHKHLRLGHIPAQVDDERRRQDANDEECPPGNVVWHQGEEQREGYGCQRPADRVAALHDADRLASMLRIHDFGYEHRANRPLTAEAKSLKRTNYEELLE